MTKLVTFCSTLPPYGDFEVTSDLPSGSLLTHKTGGNLGLKVRLSGAQVFSVRGNFKGKLEIVGNGNTVRFEGAPTAFDAPCLLKIVNCALQSLAALRAQIQLPNSYTDYNFSWIVLINCDLDGTVYDRVIISGNKEGALATRGTVTLGGVTWARSDYFI